MHCSPRPSAEERLRKIRASKMPWFPKFCSRNRPDTCLLWWLTVRVGTFAVLPQLTIQTAHRWDSGSSSNVIGTQAVCSLRFRYALDIQRTCLLSLHGSEEQFILRDVWEHLKGTRLVWKGRQFWGCSSGPCFCPVPSKDKCDHLGSQARENYVKETLHWNLWGTCEHRTSSLWELGNKEEGHERNFPMQHAAACGTLSPFLPHRK